MSDAREARNSTAPTISSGWPTRPAGIASRIQSRYSWVSRNGSIIGVAKSHGATALTLTPWRIHSEPSVRVSWTIAPLLTL